METVGHGFTVGITMGQQQWSQWWNSCVGKWQWQECNICCKEAFSIHTASLHCCQGCCPCLAYHFKFSQWHFFIPWWVFYSILINIFHLKHFSLVCMDKKLIIWYILFVVFFFFFFFFFFCRKPSWYYFGNSFQLSGGWKKNRWKEMWRKKFGGSTWTCVSCINFVWYHFHFV